MRSFIGSVTVGQIEYEPGEPQKLIAAVPRIGVEIFLVRAAAQPGGFLGVQADGCEVGSVVRFSFGLDRLVYRITELRNTLVLMEWPD